MTDIMQMLQQLLGGRGQGNPPPVPGVADPRLQAIQSMQNNVLPSEGASTKIVGDNLSPRYGLRGSDRPTMSGIPVPFNDMPLDGKTIDPMHSERDDNETGYKRQLYPQGSSRSNSDEALLDQVHKGMKGQPNPEDVPQDQWPDTYEGFTKMFGREPATDTEVEFYDKDPGAQDNQDDFSRGRR